MGHAMSSVQNYLEKWIDHFASKHAQDKHFLVTPRDSLVSKQDKNKKGANEAN